MRRYYNPQESLIRVIKRGSMTWLYIFICTCSVLTLPLRVFAQSTPVVCRAWYLDHTKIIDAHRVASPRRWDALRILSSWVWDVPYWLHSIPDADAVYRLYYMPSLRNGCIVQVVRSGKIWVLAVRIQDERVVRRLQSCVLAKSQTNPLDCSLTRPIVDDERDLSVQEITRLKRLLLRLNFWRLPKTVKAKPSLDGGDWVLTGFDKAHPSTYQITRDNPIVIGRFYQFCHYLLKIANIQDKMKFPKP